jgi:hypothetical protein
MVNVSTSTHQPQRTETLIGGFAGPQRAASTRFFLFPLYRLQFAIVPNSSNVSTLEQKRTSLDHRNGERAIFGLPKACRFILSGSTTSECERRRAYHPLLNSIDTRQQILTCICDRHSPAPKAQLCPSEQNELPRKSEMPALADAVHHSAPQHFLADSTMRLPRSSVDHHFEVALGLYQSRHDRQTFKKLQEN